MFNRIKSFAINYIVTNGCRHHCSGCTVERNNNPQITDADFELLKHFYEDMKANGVYNAELALGNTDIMSASNRKQLLQDERLRYLQSFAVDLDLQFTCLDHDKNKLEDLAQDIREFSADAQIEFGIPYEYKMRNHPKYERHLVKALDTLNSLLDNRINDVQFSVQYSQPEFVAQFGFDIDNEDFNEFISREITSYAKKDIVLPDLNRDLNDINVRMALKKTIAKANSLYLEKIKEDVRNNHATTLFVQIQPGFNESFRLNFYDGELYLCANIFDNAAVIHPFFKLKKPWTHQSMLESVLDIYHASLNYAQETHHCGSCPHISYCATKGTLTLMRAAGFKHCISILKDNEEVLQDHQDIVNREGTFREKNNLPPT